MRAQRRKNKEPPKRPSVVKRGLDITFYHEGSREAMGSSELEQKAAEIRAKPLRLVCITTTGRMRLMTVRECQEAGTRFLHVATDELYKSR